MRNIRKWTRIGALGIFISAGIIIVVSLSRGEMDPSLILDGFLMGTSLGIFVTSRLIEQQSDITNGLFQQLHHLMAENQHMVEVNAAMQAAIGAASSAPPPDKPMGRVH